MDGSSEEHGVRGMATVDSRRGRWEGDRTCGQSPQEVGGGDWDKPPPRPICASGRHPSNRAWQPGAGTRINRCVT